MPQKLDLRKLLTYKLVSLSREISFFNQRESNPTLDIQIPQLRVLSLLYSVGKSSQTEFVRNTLRGDPGNMSRYINRLESTGYIKATSDTKDRRVKWLTLTAKGSKVAQEYIKKRNLHNKDLTAEFSQAELDQLNHLLDKAVSFYLGKNYD